jgi:hypothetical protein
MSGETSSKDRLFDRTKVSPSILAFANFRWPLENTNTTEYICGCGSKQQKQQSINDIQQVKKRANLQR